MPDSKTAHFQFADQGLITKVSPDLLKDGQYRSISNCDVIQEGSIASRAGRRAIGETQIGCASIYYARKMVINRGENPVQPSTNPRYIGEYAQQPDLYRTLDFSIFRKVGPWINTLTGAITKGFSLSPYSPGGVGAPWAFIAAELAMLKDSGLNPFDLNPTNLNDFAVSGVTNATSAVVSLTFAHEIDVGTTIIVNFTGATARWLGLNYRFYAKVTGTNTLTIPLDTSGFGALTGSVVAHFQALENWGIIPAFGCAVAAIVAPGGIQTPGNLSSTATAEATDYDWRYTYQAKFTNNEGNPSETQLTDNIVTQAGFGGDGFSYVGIPLAITDGQAKVLCWGTDDPQIFKIKIWRRGGTLFDAWRLVGTIDNPGAGVQAAFVDNAKDDWILGNPILSLDADPPVPSRPAAPITGSLAQITVGGRQTVNLTVGDLGIARPGTVMHLFYDQPEDVTIEQVITLAGKITAATNASPTVLTATAHGMVVGTTPRVVISGALGAWAAINGSWLATVLGANTFSIPVNALTLGAFPVGAVQFTATVKFVGYFQHAHAANALFEIDTICGQPVNLAITYGQFQILAGDPNNPHLLYRSTGDSPEYFPPVPADGSIAVVAAGTPANGIVDLTEFRGQILTLNLYSLFETLMFNGSFTPPQQVAYKGLVARRAWCKTESEIWLLSQDGVYSWDGGTFRKRSGAIDNIFHGGGEIPGTTFGQYVNGFYPLDYSQTEHCVMEYRHNEIHLLYHDTSGDFRRIICEPGSGDRWRPHNIGNPAIEFIYTEPDTGTMVECRDLANTVGLSFYDQQVVAGGVNYTSDYFATDPTSEGAAIPFDIWLPWMELGSASSNKLLQEAFLDLDLTGSDSGVASVSVDVLQDFNDTPVETIQIQIPISGAPATAGARKLVSLVSGIDGSAGPKGREFRTLSYRIYGFAYPARIAFYSLSIRYQETGEQTAGTGSDWSNMGTRFDKKLVTMTVEFDTNSTNQTLVLDTISGRDSTVYTEAQQVFTLQNPTGLGSLPGSTKALKTFAIQGRVICKEARIRALTAAGTGQDTARFFKVLSVNFDKEDYPADVVPFTPWDDNGSNYLKYANQVTLEVNTGGQDVEVQLQADGATVFTFTVNTTEAAREANVTVPSGLTGYWWRILVDPTQANLYGNATEAPGGGTGLFQLFRCRIRLQPADRGEVGHTFDWDDLGHPWDKYLRTITVEWDDTAGSNVVLQLDTISGVGGQTYNADILSGNPITLSGGRSKCVFPLPPDTIAKMIRLYPKGGTIPRAFKQWKYIFDKEDYPSDIILSTPWRDAESPNDKNPSWVSVDADTNGVAVTIDLHNENGSVLTFTHTGTVTDRKKDYPVPVDQYGKMWRLVITDPGPVPEPAPTGKFQMFKWGLDRWHQWDQASTQDDPPDVVLWTPWTDLGWPFDKIPRDLVITVDTNGVIVPIELQTSELGTVYTFDNISGTYDNRRTVKAVPTNLIGKQWRLNIPTPPARFKLWNWSLDIVKEPAALTLWPSYEQAFGYAAWKFIKQIFLMYQSPQPICIMVVSETGSYVRSLPAHVSRTEERFYLPAIFGEGVNKSRIYSVIIWSPSGTPFKIYADGSWLEWLALASDRHGSYSRISLTEMMPINL